MTEFVNMQTLATYGGALTMVLLITQLTKGIGFIGRIPTQIWSYILAFIVLMAATVCTDGFSVNGFMNVIFNAVIVSIAANGGFSVIQKVSDTENKDG